MTFEEAKIVLENALNGPDGCAKELAIKAIDRIIPKKVLNPCGRWGGKSKGGNCPVCGSHTTLTLLTAATSC